MADNSLFPRRQDIFQGNIKDVRDSVARPSLDTFIKYFSFEIMKLVKRLQAKEELKDHRGNKKCHYYAHKQKFQAHSL